MFWQGELVLLGATLWSHSQRNCFGPTLGGWFVVTTWRHAGRNHVWIGLYIYYPLVNVYITMENPPIFMGKSTISMAIFNSYVAVYQRVPTNAVLATSDFDPFCGALNITLTWLVHRRSPQWFFRRCFEKSFDSMASGLGVHQTLYHQSPIHIL